MIRRKPLKIPDSEHTKYYGMVFERRENMVVIDDTDKADKE